MNTENINESNPKRKAYFIQFLSTLGGYLFITDIGSHLSWPSPALPHLTSKASEIPTTFEQGNWLASIDSLTGILGVFLFPIIINSIGRKYAFLLYGSFHLLSWVLIITATNFTYLCIARAIAGIGRSGSKCLICIYVGEIVDKRIRGMFLSLDRAFVNLGSFLLNTSAAFLPYKTMNLVAMSIPLIGLGTLLFMYETPYFYLLKKRDDDAVKTLMKLSGKSDPESVMPDIQRMKDAIENSQDSAKLSVKDLFTDKGSRRAFIILTITDITYAFSGYLVIQSYAQQIFQQTGSTIYSAYSVMIISGIQVLTGPFSSYLVDYYGRRVTYLLSGILSAICLSVLGCFFFFKVVRKTDLSSISWLPLVVLTVFQITCTVGLCTLPYIYAGELFSVKVKGVAVTLSAIVASSCTFASKFMAPIISEAAGLYTTLWIFCCTCVVGPLIVWYIAPETKGKNLEEILEIMRAK